MVSNDEALWVRVLRSNYGLNGSLPISIAKARSSFLWKSLSKVLLPEEIVTHIMGIPPPHPRLLTNVERVRRGIVVDSSCSICGHDSEDILHIIQDYILHIIRDCTLAKEVWKQVCPTEADQPNTCVPLKLGVQVPLADSMEEVVNLISSELTNEVEMGV
ncbi:hypothetical protein Gotur_035360 [Gossypium turneri]